MCVGTQTNPPTLDKLADTGTCGAYCSPARPNVWSNQSVCCLVAEILGNYKCARWMPEGSL